MPDFTLYVASVDVAFWGTMFNIVAMICQQDAFIWGFAALASMFLMFKGQAAASVNAANGSMATVLAHNAVGSIIPFIAAMALTSTAFQSKVTIESTTSGKVTVVANVPAAISVLPSGASIIMHELQGFVRTGFQVAGTDYTSISAMDNGFINPLKVLLTARAAVSRLGYIDSDVNAVVSSCLGPESGVDFGQVNALVLNAGNGGTGTSQGATLAQTVPVNGVLGTSLGALLFKAQEQTNTFVADITDASGAILSCPDAVAVVQGRISNTLQSSDFARIAVGAVNGMDDPMPGAGFDINKLTASYAAYRTSNAVVAAAAGGAVAAAAETINYLMVDVVNNNLSCLKASSSDKTQCYAAMIQASEIERTNLARVAEAIPALQYAGAFFNDLLALIIVLGPIIVMFMMFAGQDIGRSIKALAHILVWPMLCMGVGAEAINGMLAIHTSNFLTTIANGGYLSQSQAPEVYKHFAMEIGSASSMMASLPSIMSIIFALGGASALSHQVPHAKVGDGVRDNVAPRVANDAPILQKSSMAVAEMGSNFANVKFTGATQAVSTTARYGEMNVSMQRGLQEAIRSEHSVSSGRADLATWQSAFRSHNYQALGVDNATGERIRKAYDENTRRNESTRTNQGQDSTRRNSNDSNANFGLSGKVGPGTTKPVGVSASLGAGVTTSTSAHDGMQSTQGGGRSKEIAESEALSKSISQEKSSTQNKSHGSRNEEALDRSLSTQRDFRDNLTRSESSSDTYSRLVSENSGLLLANQSMSNSEIGQQMNSNGAFRMFNAVKGKALDMNPTFAKYKAAAADQADSGSTDSLFADKETKDAALRVRAASLMALDPKSTADEKRMALEYASGAAGAMAYVRSNPEVVKAIGIQVAKPTNETGVDTQPLIRKVENGTPHDHATKQTSSHRPSSSHAAIPHPAPTPPVASGKPTSEMDRLGDDLRQKEDRGVNGADIKLENSRQEMVATKAGLAGPDAHGTVRRAASNVVDNARGKSTHVSLDKSPQQASGRVVDEK